MRVGNSTQINSCAGMDDNTSRRWTMDGGKDGWGLITYLLARALSVKMDSRNNIKSKSNKHK